VSCQTVKIAVQRIFASVLFKEGRQLLKRKNAIVEVEEVDKPQIQAMEAKTNWCVMVA